VLAAALVLASITDSLANLATRIVGDLGLPGIFLLMAPGAACIPTASEVTLLFSGFNVQDGHYSLLAVVVVALAGELVGATIAWWLGSYGRLELVERHRIFHVKPSQLAALERWFSQYGVAAVFVCRLLPVVRSFSSLAAGVARMPFWKFLPATAAGSLPWIFGFVFIGKQVGSRWEDWKNNLHYVDYAVVALVVLGIAYLVVRWRRNRGRTVDATA
jgi:membrane protein DedA with SNARE-associated domain